ncbi:DNA primase [Jeotgalibacillus proteolyticus]|uniref:DNA primase n=1 Tax=Jeotgalibacillus proteolyticus TaxID=2082395 RepID=A0A2S5GEI3_9BACL|nr:DNA primase [Jeotgalibacillus proteolyticus]PPA71440.1 DNA primase [Jeotgalibacillus proteolyticus]
MSDRIPDELVEEIRKRTDIVDVISDYVQLKKQGRNYFGLCPFHGENSPSFSVSPEKQIFHCFGCGAGGNVYSFLMDHDGVSFKEAVAIAGAKTGVKVDLSNAESTEQSTQDKKLHQDHLEAHELLSKFFHHLLMNTNEGQKSLEYMMQRGFSEEQLKSFRIGWALPSWDFTSELLKKRGFDLSSMEQAGLVIKRDDGSYFDRFRGRIMFPVENDRGQVVAFSGRIIEKTSDEPKYLNSPETPLFQKNKVLFNYHKARGAIRREQSVVLFEGFADVISSNEHVPNGIATMGTSLSNQHIGMIKRLTNQVIICYDGDQAGIEAAFKAVRETAASGLEVKVAILPSKLDPDDYIQKNGSQKFRQEIIDSSVSIMAFKMHYFRSKINLSTEDGRLHYINSVLKEIAVLPGAVEKELYIKQLSGETNLSIAALSEQLSSITPRENTSSEPPQPPKTVQTGGAFQRKSTLMPAYLTAERHLLAHMMANAETAYTVQNLLSGKVLNKDEHQAIYTYLLAYFEDGSRSDSGAFMQMLPDRHLRAIATEINMMDINPEVGSEELNDYVSEVLKYQKMLKIKEKEAEEKEAERNNDFRKAAEIGMEIIHLRKALKR